MSFITIFPPGANDFSSNGLGLLMPTVCTIKEQANGGFELHLEHPIDDGLRWTLIQKGCIVKANAPMRESPLYELEATQGGTATVTRKLYKVDVRTRLMLRAKPSTSSKILGKYKAGTEVVRLADNGNGWYKVTVRKGGATGYMYSQYLDYVKDITETVTDSKPVTRQGVTVLPAREQLFRITSLEVDTQNYTVKADALHIFYDLRGNMLAKTYAPNNANANTAANKLFAEAMNPHEFELTSLLQGKVSGEYGFRGIAECILYPDDGILAQTGGIIVRDNYDVFLLPIPQRDMGVTIRRGKNLEGVRVNTDERDLVTRIIPVGKDEEGEDLYLDGTLYVDSPNIGKYPVIYTQKIEYDVRVGDGEEEFSTVKKARDELRKLAKADFDAGIDAATYGMEVNFVTLADSADYAEYASLQAVHIHDIVTVIDEMIQLRAKLRVTGYEWDALGEQYNSVTLGELVELEQVSYGYTLSDGSVSGSKLIAGSVSGSMLRDATIHYAKIAIAAIKQLNADAVNAIIGRFGEIAAGSVTTDALYAALAEIVTLMVKSINAETISTDELYAALADVILLRAQQIDADSITTDSLAAQYAEIVALLVEQINAENVQADRLGAVLAEFVTMYAGVGEFDFATVQNLISKALSLEQASAESVYIKNLAVTSANLLSATLGKLVLKGDDGGYYRVFVGSDGSISTEPAQPTEGEIEAGQTAGGQQIVETGMNVADLNATNLQASSAVINQILTTALTAEKITAADALIASATIPALYTTSIKAIGDNLELSANTSIQSIVGDVENQINASFSEVSQRQDAVEVQMSKKVDGDDLRTYLRYSDGTVELGRTGSRYTSQTSDNGFVVLQDGAPMASIVQNTISAPVIEGKRMITIGDFALRLGANGHLILT